MHFGLISDFNKLKSNKLKSSNDQFYAYYRQTKFQKSNLSLQVDEAKVSRFPTLSPPYNDFAKRKVLKTESAVFNRKIRYMSNLLNSMVPEVGV